MNAVCIEHEWLDYQITDVHTHQTNKFWKCGKCGAHTHTKPTINQSQEQQPVSDKDIELPESFNYGYNEQKYDECRKENQELKILLEAALNKQGSDAVEFGIWLNGKDYQSTPHFNKMRSVRQNEGKPVEISELYKLFKTKTVQSQQEQPK